MLLCLAMPGARFPEFGGLTCSLRMSRQKVGLGFYMGSGMCRIVGEGGLGMPGPQRDASAAFAKVSI